jgi:hypothetical protein
MYCNFLCIVSLTIGPLLTAMLCAWSDNSPGDAISANGDLLYIEFRGAIVNFHHSIRLLTVWADKICVNQRQRREKLQYWVHVRES